MPRYQHPHLQKFRPQPTAGGFSLVAGVAAASLAYVLWCLAMMSLMGEGSKPPDRQSTDGPVAFFFAAVAATAVALGFAIFRLCRRSSVRVLDYLLLCACLPLLAPFAILFDL